VEATAPVKVDRRRRLKHDPANCKGRIIWIENPTDEQMARANQYWMPVIRKCAGLDR